MKKIVYTIILVVAFQLVQGQQVTSILYYYKETQQTVPLDGNTLDATGVGDPFTIPVVFNVKNDGSQIIKTGDTIFVRATFNGNVAYYSMFGIVPQNIGVGSSAGIAFNIPVSRSEIIAGERANELCAEVTRVVYTGVSTPVSQTPCCATFAIIDRTNIAEFEGLKEVEIYPNPVRDKLKFENLGEATNINIYNTMGQIVRTVSSAIGRVEIDMSNLSTGVYIVKMQNGKNTRTEKIQVVQ